ncbi:hypothetical protein DFA_07394 [Cavenderia fasciculata]|uniref:Fibronectin type-III domain-containing protein n=1 Tax=Cavenderia fasciculata TaxID=261658 RepID=F4PWA7_CACFS|nr:uncharacterized protein DFA_07394 [Cavenderia fasciculata]EGG20271.1 hypothetical protein DFA_07394 [Cavenderia fasciculata]|eukprot:XP_004367254.1 hypothetical protein DFA_07394 [Cavenderia fasciculata]
MSIISIQQKNNVVQGQGFIAMRTPCSATSFSANSLATFPLNKCYKTLDGTSSFKFTYTGQYTTFYKNVYALNDLTCSTTPQVFTIITPTKPTLCDTATDTVYNFAAVGVIPSPNSLFFHRKQTCNEVLPSISYSVNITQAANCVIVDPLSSMTAPYQTVNAAFSKFNSTAISMSPLSNVNQTCSSANPSLITNDLCSASSLTIGGNIFTKAIIPTQFKSTFAPPIAIGYRSYSLSRFPATWDVSFFLENLEVVLLDGLTGMSISCFCTPTNANPQFFGNCNLTTPLLTGKQTFIRLSMGGQTVSQIPDLISANFSLVPLPEISAVNVNGFSQTWVTVAWTSIGGMPGNVSTFTVYANSAIVPQCNGITALECNITGLAVGSTVTVGVSATNFGETSPVKTVVATLSNLLGAPAIQYSSTTNSIDISYIAAGGANPESTTTYSGWLDGTSSFTNTQVKQYQFSGLTTLQTYQIKVSASNAQETTFSTITVKLWDLVNAPTVTSTVIKSKSIVINYSSTGGDPTLTRYYVNSNGVPVANCQEIVSTTCTVTTTPSTGYIFNITANNNGRSQSLTTNTFTTYPTLSPPQINNIVSTITTISFSYSVTGGVPGQTTYQVKLNGTVIVLAAYCPAQNCRFTVPPGSSNAIIVEATNNVDFTTQSTTISSYPAPTISVLKVTAFTKNSITIQFESTGGDPTVDTIFYISVNGQAAQQFTKINTATFTGLTPDSTVKIDMIASNSGSTSSVQTVTQKLLPNLLGDPIINTVMDYDTLNMTYSSTGGSQSITTTYDVSINDQVIVTADTTKKATYTFSNEQKKTQSTYVIKVVATNGQLTSENSTSIVYIPILESPIITVSIIPNNVGISISYSAIGGNNQITTTYQVLVNGFPLESGATTYTFTKSQQQSRQSYTVQVIASNGAMTSQNSTSILFTPTMAQTTITASTNVNAISASWTQVPIADNYVAGISTDSVDWNTVCQGVNVTSCQFTGLQSDTTYYIQVVSLNTISEISSTSTVQATTLKPEPVSLSNRLLISTNMIIITLFVIFLIYQTIVCSNDVQAQWIGMRSPCSSSIFNGNSLATFPMNQCFRSLDGTGSFKFTYTGQLTNSFKYTYTNDLTCSTTPKILQVTTPSSSLCDTTTDTLYVYTSGEAAPCPGCIYFQRKRSCSDLYPIAYVMKNSQPGQCIIFDPLVSAYAPYLPIASGFSQYNSTALSITGISNVNNSCPSNNPSIITNECSATSSLTIGGNLLTKAIIASTEFKATVAIGISVGYRSYSIQKNAATIDFSFNLDNLYIYLLDGATSTSTNCFTYLNINNPPFYGLCTFSSPLLENKQTFIKLLVSSQTVGPIPEFVSANFSLVPLPVVSAVNVIGYSRTWLAVSWTSTGGMPGNVSTFAAYSNGVIVPQCNGTTTMVCNITGLTPGSTITIGVTATNYGETSPVKNAAPVTLTKSLESPAIQYSATTNSIDISYNAVGGDNPESTTTYSGWLDGTSSFTNTQVKQYQFSGLTTLQTYQIKVSASNAQETTFSIVTVKLWDLVNAPTVTSTVIKSKSIVINYSSTGGDPTLTRYYVNANGAPVPNCQDIVSTTCTVTTTPSTDYIFNITANNNGRSQSLTTNTFTTYPTLSTPQINNIVSTITTISFSYSATGGVPGQTTYQVKLNGTVIVLAYCPAQNCRFTVPPGSSNAIIVEATNNVDFTTQSTNIVSYPAPTISVFKVTAFTNSSVTIQFESTGGIPNVDTIFYISVNKQAAQQFTKTNTATFTGLTPDSTVTIDMAVFNSGSSSTVQTITQKILPTQLDDPIINTVMDYDTLNMTYSSTGGSQSITTTYDVSINDQVIVTADTTKKATYTFSDEQKKTQSTYVIKVVATNGQLTSENSTSIVYIPILESPIVTVSIIPNNVGISISYSTIGGNISVATTYDVLVNGFQATTQDTSGETTYAFTPSQQQTKQSYSIQVTASNGEMTSQNSTTILFTPTMAQTTITTSTNINAISASWTQVQFADNYVSGISINGTEWNTVCQGVNVTSCQFTGLQSDTTYYIQVIASNSISEISSTSTVQATTLKNDPPTTNGTTTGAVSLSNRLLQSTTSNILVVLSIVIFLII